MNLSVTFFLNTYAISEERAVRFVYVLMSSNQMR